jgi:hypothetical protein
MGSVRDSEMPPGSAGGLMLLVMMSCSPKPPQPLEPASSTAAVRSQRTECCEGHTNPAGMDAGCADANAALATTPAPLYRVWPRSVSLPRTQGEADGVLHAVFPKYLDDLKQCRPFRSGSSWGEIDELIGEMWKVGQFVPKVEERVVGSFTAPSTREVLYRISITHCTRGLDAYRVFAIFDATDAGYASGAVKMRFGDSLLAGEDWRVLAVVATRGGSSHLLVAHDAWNAEGREGLVDNVREVVLAHPDVVKPEVDPQLAHLRAREVAEWHGVNAVWRTVAEFRNPAPDDCTTYYSVDAPSDAESHVRLDFERCAAP